VEFKCANFSDAKHTLAARKSPTKKIEERKQQCHEKQTPIYFFCM
jgi:hypothetical protein